MTGVIWLPESVGARPDSRVRSLIGAFSPRSGKRRVILPKGAKKAGYPGFIAPALATQWTGQRRHTGVRQTCIEGADEASLPAAGLR